MKNERIRELAEQAYVDVPHERDWDATSRVFDKEKFAELIVRECARIIESQDVDPTFKHRMSWAFKKHFGVEE